MNAQPIKEGWGTGSPPANIIASAPTMVIAALGGPVGALFTFFNLKTVHFRHRFVNGSKLRRILEVPHPRPGCTCKAGNWRRTRHGRPRRRRSWRRRQRQRALGRRRRAQSLRLPPQRARPWSGAAWPWTWWR